MILNWVLQIDKRGDCCTEQESLLFVDLQNILLLIFESKCCRYKLQRKLQEKPQINPWKQEFRPNIQRPALANADPSVQRWTSRKELQINPWKQEFGPNIQRAALANATLSVQRWTSRKILQENPWKQDFGPKSPEGCIGQRCPQRSTLD